MTIKYTRNGTPYGVPPYTKAEEDLLYRQAELKGPVTILRGPVGIGDDAGRDSGSEKPAPLRRGSPNQA